VSRRNQARRRRAYGRRQHEVRQRRGGGPLDSPRDWLADDPNELEDAVDQLRRGDSFGELRPSRAA
jgi:hypothetical protein